MKIRLGDADRERLGCPEWMDLDLTTMPYSEAEALQESGGDWTIIADSGAKAMKTRIWLALYRAGVVVPFTELTFDVLAATARDEDPSGKDESSDSADSPTPPTSASSTRRSPRKGSPTST